MSKKLLFGAIAALFLLSGCSDKATVDVGTQDADSKASSATGTSTVTSGDTNELSSSLIERLERNAKSIYFDFDQFDISASSQSAISDNAKLFNLVEAANLNVKVEGNCDEWGTDEYNFALGLKRAKAVKDALIAQGVKADRVTIVSYGESNPACTQASKECWGQNRRADFKLLIQ
ncbi:MAG: OmpA family protein [Campylobacteraceae bacterium]|nr:OmpA family protein [Campylobacteraceae bacterium]